MPHTSPEPLAAADAALLRALGRQYRGPDANKFDEVNIAIDAPRCFDLLSASGFLEPKIDRRRRVLTKRTMARVAHWLERMDGTAVGRMMLQRDRLGWSHIETLP